jgi:general secretion pathway protein G
MRIKTARGFTLLELVITLFILAILTLGALPLVQTAVQRQREQQLRESLREMRSAIDQFHRDVIGGPCAPAGGAVQQQGQPNPQAQPGQAGQQVLIDPRSRVMVTDCTIFSADNPDRYPPDLETLVKGVSVAPRAGAAGQTGGVGLGGDNRNATDVAGSTLATKKKVYLREIPVDPTTGKREWDLRSLYDNADSTSWGGENIFDVRSQSKATALNGEKYNEW